MSFHPFLNRSARAPPKHARARPHAVCLCACAETSVGLPFFQITGTVVEWDEVRFDVRLMRASRRHSNPAAAHTRGVRLTLRSLPLCRARALRGCEPHADKPSPAPQGPCRPPRLGPHHRVRVRQESKHTHTHTHTTGHRAYCSLVRPCLAHSFYATDAGRQHFADQLTSIRYCVQEVRCPVLRRVLRVALH